MGGVGGEKVLAGKLKGKVDEKKRGTKPLPRIAKPWIDSWCVSLSICLAGSRRKQARSGKKCVPDSFGTRWNPARYRLHARRLATKRVFFATFVFSLSLSLSLSLFSTSLSFSFFFFSFHFWRIFCNLVPLRSSV